MEVASRSLLARQVLRSRTRPRLRNSAYPILVPICLQQPSTASASRTSQRSFTTTPRCNAADHNNPNPFFGLSASGSPSSPSSSPTTYFSSRQTLPANTVIRFVPQQTAWVVERMGKFNRILEPGLAILVPFLDRIAYVRSLKESAIEIPSQNAITADNVTLELDGVLYTRVFDAYKAR